MNENNSKFIESVVRMLDDEIIKIKEKNSELRTMIFSGPAIIMLLADNKLSDDDLYISYSNNDKYKTINTKKEALELIKQGHLKDISVTYSNHYIDSQIVNATKNYIKNWNKLDNNINNSTNIINSIKTIMLIELDKFFLEELEKLQNKVLESSEIIANIQREKENEEYDDYEEYYNDDEFINLDEYEDDEFYEENSDSVNNLVDRLLEVDDIEKYIEPSKIEEFKEDRLMYDSIKEKGNGLEIINNDKYFTYIVKKYYDKKFGKKNTMYFKPNSDNIKYDFDKTKDEKYRIMITDIYNQINMKHHNKNSLDILVDILKEKIKINSDFYDSYFYKIKDYNELSQNIRLLIINDYYNSIKNNLSNDTEKLYYNLVNQQKDNKDILDCVFIHDNFGKIATETFINNSLIESKKK